MCGLPHSLRACTDAHLKYFLQKLLQSHHLQTSLSPSRLTPLCPNKRRRRLVFLQTSRLPLTPSTTNSAPLLLGRQMPDHLPQSPGIRALPQTGTLMMMPPSLSLPQILLSPSPSLNQGPHLPSQVPCLPLEVSRSHHCQPATMRVGPGNSCELRLL